MIKIIMYHYVRDNLNDLSVLNYLHVDDFKKQLDYISNNYKVISFEELLDIDEDDGQNYCLLTFDDGYKDHINYVLPELLKRNIKGLFYPSAKPLINNEILDVNMMHLILKKVQNFDELINFFNKACIEIGINKELINNYNDTNSVKFSLDDHRIRYIKEILYSKISEESKKKIINRLKEKFISHDEEYIAKNHYMNKKDLKILQNNGMHIGSHGFNHIWLDKLSYKEQKKDIIDSLDFLDKINIKIDKWTMCYPWGSYNADTITILKELKCSLGFTVNSKNYEIKKDLKYEIPRIDTVDLKF
ncbi:polysaccharide deacetylase family protein [Alphaproteobacteria bacterium]|nr:polysaccharide deacetylase family protein [Alphaproteobacteria bacterium]MDB9825045.1 polysaccharide deacetylase family protein [Alphaproteobacteria bacterium]